MKSVVLFANMSISIVSIAVSHAAYGQDPGVDCTHPLGGYEQNHCASKLEDTNDLELNTLYKKLKTKLSPTEARMLKEAESKWIALRDEICDFEVLPTTRGTGWSANYAECITRLTKNRIIDLKAAISYR